VLGLTLVVGIVVDDAIMVLENIYRHREHGEGKVKAASVGAKEITFAAAAATAAIIAIFLPVAFMKGIIGKFFFQFGVTISVAVLISLLEALTLAPMRLSRMLEVGERGTRLERAVNLAFARLAAGYERLLVPALKYRRAVLVVAAALFFASLGIIRLLRQEFIPAQDMSRFGIRFQTPVGSSIDSTEKVLTQIEQFLASRPEVDKFGGVVGGFGGGEVNSGFSFVTMKDPPERPRRPKDRAQAVAVRAHERRAPGDERHPGRAHRDAGLLAARLQPGPRRRLPGRVQHPRPRLGRARRASRVIMEKMRESGLVTDVDSDYQVGMPEVQVVPDRNKAADVGVSMAAIGDTINSAIGGQRMGKFKDKGRRFDIRVRMLAQQRQRPEDIDRLLVRTGTGGLVRLGDIVRIEQRPTLQAITRRDRERAITLFANVAPGVSQSTAIERSVALAREALPENYRAVPSGTAKTFAESFDSLKFAMGLGLLVAYMVLASQFNAFTHPFTVLLALPFSVSGALLALWLAGQSLNVYSMLGVILLMGIAKKNSILLVDFTNQIREQGIERHEALLQACPIRLRPILMTSVATIAGALAAGARARAGRRAAAADGARARRRHDRLDRGSRCSWSRRPTA
jgi:HAE1 family hydrophobic/amphiphilic exporter-1